MFKMLTITLNTLLLVIGIVGSVATFKQQDKEGLEIGLSIGLISLINLVYIVF